MAAARSLDRPAGRHRRLTTAWDAAHQVIATMGDRFVLVRLGGHAAGKAAAGRGHAQRLLRGRRCAASSPRRRQAASVISSTGSIQLTDAEIERILRLADLVTRARTGVERDYQGNPVNRPRAGDADRLAKQLVQLARGGIAIGMTRTEAMAVVSGAPGHHAAARVLRPRRCRLLPEVLHR